MSRLLPLLTGLTLLFGLSPARAESEAQLAAIRSLGELNGIALHCRALAQTQRMKRALVATLPKRRQLGELFDYETNRAFLSFIERQEVCPGPQDLSRRVDAALQALQAAYGDTGGR